MKSACVQNNPEEIVRRLEALAEMKDVQKIWPEFDEGRGIFPARLVLEYAASTLRDQRAEIARLRHANAALSGQLPRHAPLALDVGTLTPERVRISLPDGGGLIATSDGQTLSIEVSGREGGRRLTAALALEDQPAHARPTGGEAAGR